MLQELLLIRLMSLLLYRPYFVKIDLGLNYRGYNVYFNSFASSRFFGITFLEHLQHFRSYTLCLKKVFTFKLSINFLKTLAYLIFKFLHYWKAHKICNKTHTYYPPHLKHVATLPRKIKKSNFSRYSADMDENANELHFKFTAFNFLCV